MTLAFFVGSNVSTTLIDATSIYLDRVGLEPSIFSLVFYAIVSIGYIAFYFTGSHVFIALFNITFRYSKNIYLELSTIALTFYAIVSFISTIACLVVSTFLITFYATISLYLKNNLLLHNVLHFFKPINTITPYKSTSLIVAITLFVDQRCKLLIEILVV